MKRMHINLAVTNLDASVKFYSSLFSTPPTVLKKDYAKWMLDDPRINFAISTRSSSKGLDHLGIQVESDEELQAAYAVLETAGAPTIEQGETTCCYARSEKSWTFDPDGIAWETFLTRGESPVYGSDIAPTAAQTPSACCAPTRAKAPPSKHEEGTPAARSGGACCAEK